MATTLIAGAAINPLGHLGAIVEGTGNIMEIMEAIGITMTTRERNSVMGETRAAKTTPDNDVESVRVTVTKTGTASGAWCVVRITVVLGDLDLTTLMTAAGIPVMETIAAVARTMPAKKAKETVIATLIVKMI